MSPGIHLLGNPRIEFSADGYRIRSQKSWAILAYLLLADLPPTRSRLASLLFEEAEDPLRALRWSLSELRRALGANTSIEGDPVVLTLPEGSAVDVLSILHGGWLEAVRLPGLGHDLLEGAAYRNAPVFEAWLLSTQRHIAASSEAILHEAALASMSGGDYEAAISYGLRLVTMNALDENHQALLIRAYQLAGDAASAQRQFEACAAMFRTELGIDPGPAVRSALQAARPTPASYVADEIAIAAMTESGTAAVSAGAVEAGVQTLHTAVALADEAQINPLRASTRLALAEALIHSVRGEDEGGSTVLHETVQIAERMGDNAVLAEAQVGLGYVDFLRARYERATKSLSLALILAPGDPTIAARAGAYLGSVESDRSRYPEALSLLHDSIDAAVRAGVHHQRAYSESMIGRVHLLCGQMDEATAHLEESIALTKRERWLSFLPWPQALLGEVEIVGGDPERGEGTLKQAFARACQLGDPCWEGVAGRGLALAAEAFGRSDEAFAVLAMPGCAVIASPTATCGSTCTSWTPSANWGCDTTIQRPSAGPKRCITWPLEPECEN